MDDQRNKNESVTKHDQQTNMVKEGAFKQVKKINRRSLLTTISMAGAAVVSGGVVHALNNEAGMLGGNPHDKMGDLNQLETIEKSNLVGAINENVRGIADIVLNVKSFGAIGDGLTDDTVAIQAAIDYLDSQYGGTLLFPSGIYVYSQDIHLKEGTVMKGNGGTFLKCTAQQQARIIFYNNVKMENISFTIEQQYDDAVFYFDNRYLTNQNRRDTSKENCKVFIEKVQMFTEYDANRNHTVAFQLYASRQREYTPTAGFWGVNVRDCFIDGFNLVISLKTDITGWINGNTFENISCDHFESVVIVNKSTESLGVDHNIFRNLRLQTRPFTKDIFSDAGSLNRYQDIVFSDMKTNTSARIGISNMIASVSGRYYPKERYGQWLQANRYHLLGRFQKFTSLVNHVMISVNAYGNYRTDYFIRGKDEQVERRNYGSTRLHDQYQFYKRELGNGEVELYIRAPQETEVVVYIESFRSFFPSTNVAYEELDGVVELTNIQDYYPPASPTGQGVHLPSDNNYTGLTLFDEIHLGISYSTIRSNQLPAGTPEDLAGTLVTHKITEGPPYGFNYQEFHPYNSQTGNFYKRYAGTEGWHPWRKINAGL